MAASKKPRQDRSEHYLILGTAEGDGAVSRLRASGTPYKVKRIQSGPGNWKDISQMLADPKLKAVVLKLTGSDYELFLRGSYEGVARELLDNLAMKPNMVLVYESLLTGSTVDDSEPEYKPEDVVVQQELGLGDPWFMDSSVETWLEGESEPSEPEDLFRLVFHMPPDDVRTAVHELFYSRNVEILSYRTNAQLSVLVSSFLDDCADNLLFRIYVPQGKLYAEEAGRLLHLFRDWLTTVKSHRVREDGYTTQAGRVDEFYTDHDTSAELTHLEVGEFLEFLTTCALEPGEATTRMIDSGMERAAAGRLVTKYGKEGRRIQLDVRQARETLVLGVKHAFEAEVSEGQEPAFRQQVDELVEGLIPDSGSSLRGIIGGGALNISANTMTLNLSQQSIGAASRIVQTSIQGTAHFGTEPSRILELIQEYGQSDIVESETLVACVHELEDDDCRNDIRLKARERLKSFLVRLGKEVESSAITVLVEYIQHRAGG